MAIEQKDQAHLILSRFGFGAGLHTELKTINTKALLHEIERGVPELQAPDPLLTLDQGAAIFIATSNASMQKENGSRVEGNYRNETAAVYKAAYDAEIGFTERWIWFWANHFAVSIDKNRLIRLTAGAFERECIRKYAYSSFDEMLLAVETHPVMLGYLDNSRSVGANSKFGLRSKQGLNENLAREILELHTLGVRSGYTQNDVTELAKIITGWTAVPPKETDSATPQFQFVYAPNRHEPGVKTLLGKTYPEGFEAGKLALRDLARNPHTAEFIAGKIATHFISDTPPASLITKLKDVFIKTNGNLKAIAIALVTSDEAKNPTLSKIRKPQEWIAATTRAIGFQPEPQRLNGVSLLLGQPNKRPPSPKGFSDLNPEWLPALAQRLDVAQALARAAKLQTSPLVFAEHVLGNMSPTTRQTISRAESLQQAIVLTLLSPEFIRR
jgi:uncharacterized protein (DUF1800 family)